jgi:hypothetical protein
MVKTLLAFAALLPFTVYAQVYKCEVNGVVQFTQQPCADDAELTSYKTEIVESVNSAVPPSQQAQTHIDTLNRISESIRKRDINIEISKLTTERKLMQQKRDMSIDRLRQTKQSAANNLAGATWEEALSKEMSAVAIQYDTDIRTLDNQIDRLRAELNSI